MENKLLALYRDATESRGLDDGKTILIRSEFGYWWTSFCATKCIVLRKKDTNWWEAKKHDERLAGKCLIFKREENEYEKKN